MKPLLIFVTALSILAAGCSSGVVTPGNVIRSALPEKTNTLEDAWPEAGNVLLSQGLPVQLDTYTSVHGISGSGILVIDVRSFDFDPIAVVIDGEGNLVAFNDNWKKTNSARVVLDGAPAGGKLLVFSPDDTRGLYDVVVEEGTENDLADFVEATDFSSGTVTGWIEEGSYNSCMESTLREVLEEYIYIYNFSQARLYPFTMENDMLISISLESDEFDPYLVLMSVENGEYTFVDYNDDFAGSYSRIVRQLEAGDYIALVMPYSAGGNGRFTLQVEQIDEAALEAIEISAPLQNTDYAGGIVIDSNFAVAWWPDMMDSWEVPGFLNPFAPVASYTFTVAAASLYEINASGEMDVCLTLLMQDGDSIIYMDSNDDYFDLGTNSRIVKLLMPGDYVALISPYSGMEEGEVTFSWSVDDSALGNLAAGRSTEVDAPYETDSFVYQLHLREGFSYSISVESDELDPVITLYLPDGESLYDDDGGDGTNSLLNFTVGEGQAGDCFLVVEKYSSGEGAFTIRFMSEGR